MKNILIISGEFPPSLGGAGVNAKSLVDTFIEEGHKVILLTKNHYTNDNEQLSCISVGSRRKIWILRFIVELLRLDLNVFDKIILNDPFSQYIFSLIANSRYFERCYLYVHGVERRLECTSFLDKLFFFEKMTRRVYTSCHSIAFVSKYIKETTVNYYGMAPENKSFIVSPLTHNIYSNTPINKDTIGRQLNLLSVSRVTIGKGYSDMYNIFKSLVKYKCVHWNIVGDGPYLDELKAKVINDGLTSRVSFLGAINNENTLQGLYANADVFWQMSLLEESYGLVYVEAALSGCKVIAYNRCGPKNIINKNNGFLVNDIDEVEPILSSIVSYDRNLVAESTKEFSYDAVRIKILKFYGLRA